MGPGRERRSLSLDPSSRSQEPVQKRGELVQKRTELVQTHGQAFSTERFMEQLLRVLSGGYCTPTIPAPTCTAHELTGASSPVGLDTEPAGAFDPATVDRQGRIDLSK
jgi:hypothetical protein